MRILNRIHLHPYLLGIFPVLSLYAHNQSQLQPNAVWRSLAVIIAGTTVVFLALRLFFKDWAKAGLITSCASVLFFLYGPLREAAHNFHFAKFNLSWNRYFLPLWILILLLGVWMIAKRLHQTGSAVQIFNLVAISALLLPSLSIVSYSVRHLFIKQPSALASSYSSGEQNSGAARGYPDIYYIILDMYGRSDTIEDEFGYDNSPFLAALRKEGFYVAACSTSNYSHTILSMTSALNMDFLPALGSDFVAGNTDYSNAQAAIGNNAVRKYLKQHGYSFVTFQADFPFLNIPDADHYIKIGTPSEKNSIEPFELFLIDQTPLKILLDQIASEPSGKSEIQTVRIYGSSYDRTLFVLEKIPQLPTAIPGPKFVYAHLIIPHPPYVFGPHGEYVGNDKGLNDGPNHAPVDQAAYQRGYSDQLRYIDSVLPAVLRELISRSDPAPVIIVQGDHGFWGGPPKRLPILNAYFLPGQDPGQGLYPTITPVNSFRVVLNAYFESQLPLLPDESYATVDDQDFYHVEPVDPSTIPCRSK